MAIDSAIAWTRSTFNPWIGCTKVGPGCDHCYAENLDSRKRWGGVTHWGAGVPRHRTSASNWKQPLAWNRQAAKTGEFWPVFCASLADVFDNEVSDEWRADLFNVIEQTPHLTWQLVTKRIGNVLDMVPAHWIDCFPPNVWQLATIVNKTELERDGLKLATIPAVVRGVSYEPAVEYVNFKGWIGENRLNWIIVGGESGSHARPFRAQWAREVVRECRKAGTAVFVKQLGANVIDRNDAGFDGCEPWEWPDGMHDRVEHDIHGFLEQYQGADVRIRLQDRAGADPSEWPEDLRVREFPRATDALCSAGRSDNVVSK